MTNLQNSELLEGIMETIDQIYLWKRLFWQAVSDGCEPGEAERIANSRLPCQQRTMRRAAPTVRISTTFAVPV